MSIKPYCPLAAAGQSPPLYDLFLEDLLHVQVSTASLRERSALEVPSKVQVIGKQQISDRHYRYTIYGPSPIAR